MYRTLAALAGSLDSDHVERLAQQHLTLEEGYSRRLWPYIGLLEKLAQRPPRIKALLGS